MLFTTEPLVAAKKAVVIPPVMLAEATKFIQCVPIGGLSDENQYLKGIIIHINPVASFERATHRFSGNHERLLPDPAVYRIGGRAEPPRS